MGGETKYKYKNNIDHVGEITRQLWTSDEVSGSLVKMTIKTGKGETRMELTKFTKK
jgi:hypothetical protein